MLLQFVTDPTIGPKDRRLIRSHVMKGKNAGKPRPARKRLIHRSIANPACTNQDDSEDHQSLAKPTSSLPQVSCNKLRLSSLPCHMGSALEGFIYQRMWLISKALYPPEFCTELNLAQYAWTRFVFEDTAYLHTLLAISASFPNHFGGPRRISPNALHHISLAYRMTNARLSGPEACSDKAIAVVTMLAIYQRMHHQQAVGLVHFQGLRRMIALRGGLNQLSRDNRALTQKPWRLGIEFALQDGGDVVFEVDEAEELTGLNDHITYGCSNAPKGMDTLDPALRVHFESIAYFTKYLNTNVARLDPMDYSDAVCIRLHRLLAYEPLSIDRSPRLSPLDNLVHLTLVAIMTTLMPEYGHNQARYRLLGDKMLHAFRVYTATRTMNYEILLWALFIGYTTILSGDKGEARLAALAADVCMQLDLHDWSSIHRVLRGYAWIDVIYDKVASKVLSRITGKQDGPAT